MRSIPASQRYVATSLLIIVVAAILAFTVPSVAGANTAFVVSTSAGRLRGIARPGGGAEFLGIPYAEPPVGELRWRAPLPAKHWDGVRDATAFGAPCTQPLFGGWNQQAALTGREDCLYLNVIVPKWPLGKPLPVMFFIHGGSNQGGTGGGPFYNSGTLVSHGVVLVTINYRLGVFGFLAHPALSRESPRRASGDYGLMDQILALEWVRRNIAQFGGDPTDITVFGQSAGAEDTAILMASRARMLFQRAIEESGAPVGLPTLQQAERMGVGLAAALEAPPGDAAIAYLRKLPASALIARIIALPRARQTYLGPDVDGWVLAQAPAKVFAGGQESPIPLLFGTTTRELDQSIPTSMIRAFIQKRAVPFVGQTLAAYGVAHDGRGTTDPKYGNAGEQLSADASFRCPEVLEASWHTAAGHPTYEYEFDHPLPGQPFAGHSAELPYVFGFFHGNYTAADHRLADMIQTYWTNFAKTGDPNSDRPESGRLPGWPVFGRARSYLQFLQGDRVATAQDLRYTQCSLYRAIFLAHMGRQAR